MAISAVSGWAAALPPAPLNLHVLSNYYVSVSGSATNSGSVDSPLALSSALSKALPGDVIVLLPGTYPSIVIRTPGLTLRSLSKWMATVVGSPAMHGIEVNSNNVVIDGLEVSHSYIDGIKLNASGVTVRNCWIHHSGLGDTNAVANTNESFTGQGIYSGAHDHNTIERNLIEYNGIWIGHDHGVYISGTNHVIRGNVLRHNWTYGLQLYTGYAGESCSGIAVYDNLIYANGNCDNGRNCLTVWAGPPGSGVMTTNYVFNNTLIASTYYPVICDSGYLALSNNIILGSYDGTLIAVDGGTIWSDHNCFTNTLRVGNGIVDGGHNLIVSDPGFVNAGQGLFWLTANSPARGSADPAVMPPVDFFGMPQTSYTDIGAFQYNQLYETDIRVLDPSSSDPDYWLVR
jgi:hypothetical protein